MSPESGNWRQMTGPGFPVGLGPLLARRDGAVWEYGLALTEAHANASGMVHGGVLLALLDHAMSLSAWEAARRAPCVTVQLGTQFLRAARAGAFVHGRGHVVQLTRSLVFMQGEVTVDGAELVATAEGIWKILGRAEQVGSDE